MKTTTPEPAALPTTAIGRGLVRFRGRAALWRDKEWRRAGFQMLRLGVRSLGGFRFGAAGIFLVFVGFVLTQTAVTTARQAYTVLQGLMLLGVLFASLNLYGEDRRQGTLELLWLGFGSAREMLRFKVLVLLAALACFAVPGTWMLDFWVDGQLPSRATIFFLLTSGYFLLAFMAWTGSLVPGGLGGWILGVALMAGVFALFREGASPINPFMNPVGWGAQVAVGGGAFQGRLDPGPFLFINRIFVLLFAGAFLRWTAARASRLVAR